MATFLRQEENRKILEILTLLVDKYPDWRFHQILQNSSITKEANPNMFYEESSETYKRVMENSFIQSALKYLKF